MTNETFEPVGLLEITKQLKTNRKSVDDLEDRLHSALDAKRDVASNYVKQLDEVYDDIDCHPDYDAKTDSIAEKEVEVKLDPITDLIQTTVKTNDAVYMSGYDAGYEKGFWKGYNKALTQGPHRLVCKNGAMFNEDANEEAVHDEHLQSLSSMTEDEISQELIDAGIDIDELVESVQETIKAHEK